MPQRFRIDYSFNPGLNGEEFIIKEVQPILTGLGQIIKEVIKWSTFPQGCLVFGIFKFHISIYFPCKIIPDLLSGFQRHVFVGQNFGYISLSGYTSNCHKALFSKFMDVWKFACSFRFQIRTQSNLPLILDQKSTSNTSLLFQRSYV